MSMREKMWIMAICLVMCSAWIPTPRRSLKVRIHRGYATTKDDFSAWEAAMIGEHKKDCARAKDLFATVPEQKKESTIDLDGDANDRDADRLTLKFQGGGDYDGGWDAFAVPPDSVGLGNDPYFNAEGGPQCDLIHVSRKPLLTAEECSAIVTSAEKTASEAGWGSRYTYAKSSHEVHVADCPVAKVVVDSLLATTLLPSLSALHPRFAPASRFRVYNSLVVKYDASTGRSAMPVHADFGLFTLNICLNDRGEDYEGGGTWFQALGATLAPPRGHGVVHASPLAHSGVPTTSGVRYQLVVFVLDQEFSDVGGRLQHLGATMLGAGKDAGSALRALGHSLRGNRFDAETWFQLGRARMSAGDLPGAVDAYSRAVGLGAGGSRALFEIELAAASSSSSSPRENGKEESSSDSGSSSVPGAAAAAAAALKACRAALGENGDDDEEEGSGGSSNVSFEALFSLACALQAMNATATAGNAFQLSVELGAPPGLDQEARERDAQHNWALTLMAQEKFEAAGLILQQVVTEDPKASESWASLGVCMVSLGQPLAARVCQTKVLELQTPAEDTGPTIALE